MSIIRTANGISSLWRGPFVIVSLRSSYTPESLRAWPRLQPAYPVEINTWSGDGALGCTRSTAGGQRQPLDVLPLPTCVVLCILCIYLTI
jgi:hypothetical protein